MQDKIIVCRECGRKFVFSVREQEFYEAKDFSDPLRCKECRKAKKNNRF